VTRLLTRTAFIGMWLLVTACPSIDRANMFGFWDRVGGRYSMDSARAHDSSTNALIRRYRKLKI
jgi:phosphoglucose isomerase-like protein